MKKRPDLSRDFYIISFLTAATVLIWIVADAYRILTRAQEPTGYEEQLKPFSPEINREVLAGLASRETISLAEISTLSPATPAPTPTPEATPSAGVGQEATPAAQPEAT